MVFCLVGESKVAADFHVQLYIVYSIFRGKKEWKRAEGVIIAIENYVCINLPFIKRNKNYKRKG